jgi:hypothetical protein
MSENSVSEMSLDRLCCFISAVTFSNELPPLFGWWRGFYRKTSIMSSSCGVKCGHDKK